MKSLTVMSAVLLSALLASPLFAEEQKSQPRVLLAFEQTRFKSALVEAMRQRLQEAGMRVTVAQHTSKGLDAKAADFDAIFISNSGANSRVRPWIVEWLAANKAHQGKILLHTTQTRDWKVQADVDAVTSASSQDRVDDLAARYVQRLKEMVGE